MDPTLPSTDDPEPQPPRAPADTDCCGNGCDPCVYDFYRIERERYDAALKAWRERQAQRGATRTDPSSR